MWLAKTVLYFTLFQEYDQTIVINHGLEFRWFLYGHKDAQEGSEAYFKDVFESMQMYDGYLYNINKRTFNEAIIKNIKNKWGPMALTMILGSTSHAVILLGDVYGDDVCITHIIKTNRTGWSITKVKITCILKIMY